GRGGIWIDVRAADAADSVGRAILFVVGMQNKKNVERPLQRWIRPVLRFRSAKEHIQKVARIAELIVRIHKRHAQSVPVGERRDGRNFSNQTVGLLLARLYAENVLRVVIKSRQRGDRRAHHAKIFGVHFDLAEVGGADGVVRDGNLVGFARAIVRDGERFAGSGRAFRLSRLRGGKWGVHSSSSGQYGTTARPSYSLYTKRGAAGNWPK